MRAGPCRVDQALILGKTRRRTMQVDTEQALTSLQDVAGVEGSFLVDSAGALAAWNMPPTVEAEILDEAGVKLARLRQAFAVAGQELDFCTVRFANYNLC